MTPPTLQELRRYAVARTLFAPTTLRAAIQRLGFVQADPIRAPARAQDLTLRHRVRDYRAGDLDRCYPRMALEEDFFVNYGYLPRAHRALMHPRAARSAWTGAQDARAAEVVRFIRERGAAHPREVHALFQMGRATNWFGGTSRASTQLLDEMHYRGMLRVARREAGTRVYAVVDTPPAACDAATAAARMDALVDLVVRQYAPLPGASLAQLIGHLRGGAPQWAAQRAPALARARHRLAHASVDGVPWYWPAHESPRARRWCVPDEVRLLAPFDPLVWDRRRFEVLWGWAYRFEAYTPAPQRQRGYYALPLLWRDQVVGWGNVTLTPQGLECRLGYAAGRAPRDAGFRTALGCELERLRSFLGVSA